MKLQDMSEALNEVRAQINRSHYAEADTALWSVLDNLHTIMQGLVDRQLTTLEDTTD